MPPELSPPIPTSLLNSPPTPAIPATTQAGEIDPPGAPWWYRVILARERIALAIAAHAWRWAAAREAMLWALLCETYAQFGDQLFPHLTQYDKLQIAAAAFVISGLLRPKPTVKESP